jgi:drug/metabolite transporter (DMT)-like permease
MTDAAFRRRLLLCLLTVYLVWGSSYLMTRIGVLRLPPLLFGGIRFSIAGVLLLAFAQWRGSRPFDLRGELRHVVVMALLGVALVNGLQVWALQWVPSQTGALLNASSAFWIVAFGFFGRRSHRPPPRVLAGILTGFIGTAVLVWPGRSAGATPLVPQLAILVACLGWALATAYLRHIRTRLDVFALTGWQMGIGGALLTALGLAAGEADRWVWSPLGLAAMAWLVVMSSCIAHTAYAWLAQNATPAQVGTYSYVNPAIAAVLGFLVLGEALTPLQLAGTGVILAGVGLVNWPARGTPLPAEDAI